CPAGPRVWLQENRSKSQKKEKGHESQNQCEGWRNQRKPQPEPAAGEDGREGRRFTEPQPNPAAFPCDFLIVGPFILGAFLHRPGSSTRPFCSPCLRLVSENCCNSDPSVVLIRPGVFLIAQKA